MRSECLKRGLRIAAVLLAIPSLASAIYTPNPAGRWQAHRFFLGGDMQFNASKNMDANRPRAFDVDNMYGFFVRPGFSVAENVVVYGRLGVQGAEDVHAGFAGGFGVQGAYVIPALPELAVGGAFDYVHWAGEFTRGPNINWNEFQITPGVSYQPRRFQEFSAYGGVMFDIVDARRLSEQDLVGLLLGVSYDFTDNFRLEGQARVISEDGLFIGATYIF